MPTCKECGEEVEELKRVRAKGRTVQACEDCTERLEQEEEIAQESEAAVQDMMGFKGRR